MNNRKAILDIASSVDRLLTQHSRNLAVIQSQQLDFSQRADRINAALAHMVELMYALKEGFPVGYDAITNKLLFHVPWSSAHYRAWKLGATDRVVLFRLTQEWRDRPTEEQIVWFSGGHWYVNLRQYPTHLTAKLWLSRELVDARIVNSLQREGPVRSQPESR